MFYIIFEVSIKFFISFRNIVDCLTSEDYNVILCYTSTMRFFGHKYPHNMLKQKLICCVVKSYPKLS